MKAKTEHQLSKAIVMSHPATFDVAKQKATGMCKLRGKHTVLVLAVVLLAWHHALHIDWPPPGPTQLPPASKGLHRI